MKKYDISVRNLVEFILRHGDIEPGSGVESPERAMAGTRIHKKLQSAFKEADSTYEAEKAVSYRIQQNGFDFVISGRADGIRFKDGFLHIDEIKTVDRDVKSIDKPELLHMAQGRCYGAILGQVLPDVEKVETNVLYCNIETMEVKDHGVVETPEQAMSFFQHLIDEYVKWISFYQKRSETCRQQLKNMKFPYGSYRKGQRELAVSVYRTIKDGGKMFANAPTGIGKTVSTLFPALKAMGEGHTDKIFYLTARNAGALPPGETADILRQQTTELSYISLTSKEKICPYGLKCDPHNCPRAKGHYDRINDAMWQLLNSENAMTRESLIVCGEEFSVCPFELGLDCSYFAQVVIGDYNYLFDPRVRLARFFGNGGSGSYVFLIDEAHNLPDRVRTMYTVGLNSNRFLFLAEEVKAYSRGFYNGAVAVGEFLNNVGNVLREQDLMQEFSFTQDDSVLPVVENFCEKMSRFTDTKTWKQKMPEELKNKMLELYFESLFYIKISDLYDEKFCFLKEIQQDGSLTQTLFCGDPSGVIKSTCELGRAAVFFSGTLAPMNHYLDMMGGTNDDAVIDVPSPFPSENRLSLGAYDVATTYKKRSQYYDKAAEYIQRLTELPVGNYMVFFSSYKYLKEVESRLPSEMVGKIVFSQPNTTRPDVREKFLRDFRPNPKKTHIGLCVLGGIYSEGVDLTGDRLSGVIVVGVGLPMVCRENEIIRAVTGKDEPDKGFRTAYVFPGINKVLQAAGRVIRTDTDRGFIVFLDERYQSYEYEELLPYEYHLKRAGSINTVFEMIKAFL